MILPGHRLHFIDLLLCLLRLPDSIQASVCNADIKIDNFLYQLFWTDGAW